MTTAHAVASRRAIVHAVWTLIAQCGIEGATFRRVADQAGVSVGRIQHHFGTRDALVYTACTEMIEDAHTDYQGLPDDPKARLRHILLHAVPDTPRARFGASVWHAYLAKSVDDERIASLLAETKRGTENEAIRLIEQLGESSPSRTARDIRHTARYLLALADGLTLRVLVGDLTGAEARESLDAELNAAIGPR